MDKLYEIILITDTETNYRTKVTEEVYQRLTTEPTFANKYIERLQNGSKPIKDVQENFSSSNIVDVINDRDEQLNMDITTDSTVVVETIGNKKETELCNFTWNREKTKLLLNSYADRVTKFRNPKIKKKSIWEEIKKEFIHQHYSNVTVDILDRKMRNLKCFYKTIKDNNNKKSTTGRGRIQWEWFDLMENIFAEDKTVNFGNTISSVLPTVGNETNLSHKMQTEKAQLTDHKFNQTTDVCFQDCMNNSDITQDENNYSVISSEVDQSQSIRANTYQNAKIQKKSRAKQLYHLRKERIKFEEQRIQEISRLAIAVEERNKIETERNNIEKERNNLLSNLIETLRNNHN